MELISQNCKNVMNINDIDEFSGYANGDGTYTIVINTWLATKEGEKKATIITIPRGMLPGIEMLEDKSGRMYTLTIKDGLKC